MTVLLTDGSSLASRQIATALAWSGHHVEAVDRNPLCLARMTRHVRRVHQVPSFGAEPLSWLAAVLRLLETRSFDVVLPTQEQAALLAKVAEQVRRRGVGLAVPDFRALARVQDKVAAEHALGDLDVPRPHTDVVYSAAELLKCQTPVFVKRAIGTASNGVRRATTANDLRSVAEQLEREGAFGDGVVAQRPADGPLVMVQALYDHGVLVAHHCCERVREGAGGGASAKTGRSVPGLREVLSRFGEGLGWHAAVSFDVILSPDGLSFIDVNPRLVEPLNALFSGVDLVDGMLRLSRGEAVREIATSGSGARTHQLLLALLGAAREGRGDGEFSGS
ncbi:ATP-grasp domain-containing protein [Streptomyces tuirus]|uniref:ATP-grasp domain-containing protein n=1 Tax=Streptomyces tuirus TaxID=68278 RepID=A0A941FJM1_9ACTN|nr:ATP-grasp domain-containing protein [Streptomyces tuirus]